MDAIQIPRGGELALLDSFIHFRNKYICGIVFPFGSGIRMVASSSGTLYVVRRPERVGSVGGSFLAAGITRR